MVGSHVGSVGPRISLHGHPLLAGAAAVWGKRLRGRCSFIKNWNDFMPYLCFRQSHSRVRIPTASAKPDDRNAAKYKQSVAHYFVEHFQTPLIMEFAGRNRPPSM
jgi:hypothetical protein